LWAKVNYFFQKSMETQQTIPKKSKNAAVYLPLQKIEGKI